MKNITALLLGIFLALAACVLAQSNTQQPTEKKTWEITQLDMEDYVGSKVEYRQERISFWKEKGATQYEDAKKKLLGEGWEPYSASLRVDESRRTFSDSTIVFFRRLK